MKKIVIFVIFFLVHVAYADFTNNLPPFVMRDGLQYDLVVENGDSIFGAWNYPSFYYFQNNIWSFAVVYERLPLGFPGNFETGNGRDCVAFAKSTNGAYDWMYFLGWNGQYCGSNNEGTNSLGITWGTVGTWTNFVYVAPATNGSWEAVISNGVAGGNSQLVIILSNAAPDWAASASGIGSLVNALGGTGTTSAANMLKAIDDRFIDANSSEYFQQWDDDFYSRVAFDNDRLKTTLGGDVVNVQQYGNWSMTVNGMDDYLTGATYLSGVTAITDKADEIHGIWWEVWEWAKYRWGQLYDECLGLFQRDSGVQSVFKDAGDKSVFTDGMNDSVFKDYNGRSVFKDKNGKNLFIETDEQGRSVFLDGGGKSWFRFLSELGTNTVVTSDAMTRRDVLDTGEENEIENMHTNTASIKSDGQAVLDKGKALDDTANQPWVFEALQMCKLEKLFPSLGKAPSIQVACVYWDDLIRGGAGYGIAPLDIPLNSGFISWFRDVVEVLCILVLFIACKEVISKTMGSI